MAALSGDNCTNAAHDISFCSGSFALVRKALGLATTEDKVDNDSDKIAFGAVQSGGTADLAGSFAGIDKSAPGDRGVWGRLMGGWDGPEGYATEIVEPSAPGIETAGPV